MTTKIQFLAVLGSDDGKWIFESIFAALKKNRRRCGVIQNENPGYHPAD
jgi:hypothetical protein